jgi:hypothetical protein
LKAVVMEIRGAKAVLLTERGTFELVKNDYYSVGQEVFWAEKRRIPVRRWLLAASILLVLMAGTGTLATVLPFTYMSLDVNPSLEYSLNWFDRVVSVRATNDDAEPIAQKLLEEGVVNQPADQAIGMAIAEFQQSGYFNPELGNKVILAVASLGIKNVNGLTERIADCASEYERQLSVTIITFQADADSVKRSRELDTTVGKLMLANAPAQLAKQSDLADPSADWQEMPLRDILDLKKADQQSSAPVEREVAAPTPVPSAEPEDRLVVKSAVVPSFSAPAVSAEPKVTSTPRVTTAPKVTPSPTPKATPAPKATSVPKVTPAPKHTPAPKATPVPKITPTPKPPAATPKVTSTPKADSNKKEKPSPNKDKNISGRQKDKKNKNRRNNPRRQR